MNRSSLMKQRKRREIRVQRSALQTATVMRSVDYSKPSRAVIATETPIQKYDEQTDQVVREVLLMNGVEFRGGRNQIPIVDSHDDKTVRNIFGSIQNIRTDLSNGELYGVPVFASDAESQAIATRMNEGHITDFSITAIPTESIFVVRGQSYTTDRGETIEGPALIHTRWTPLNASICATGADENSTVRRSYTDLTRKVSRMDEALVAELSAIGLPEGMTDPNQVLAWVVGKMKDSDDSEEVAPMVENMEGEPPAAPAQEEPKPEVVENMDGEKKPEEMVARQMVVTEIKRALEADKKRRKEIIAACTLAKVERAIADQWCESGISVSEARKRIIERMATEPLGTSVGADVRVTESADDKFANAVSAGIIMRSHNKAAQKLKSDEGNDFVNKPLDEIARECLLRSGAKIERMSRKDVVLAAMGNPRVLKSHNILMRSAYHTTGSFPNILLDAINKSLLAEYEEAPYTWSMWARQAASVPDLKTIYRTRISEFPNLEMVPENAKYPEKQMSDSKESYQISKYGAEFTVSWETIINDDLDAISRTTAKMGVAARRTQNNLVYSVLTSNPTMGDGNALFSSSHASGDNTSGSAAAPAVATLNAGFLKMRKQIGLTAGAVLNIEPRYLIVPVNYEATAMQLLGSFSDPAVGGNAAGNSNTLNIYGPGGQRKTLTLVAEPLLDAASSTNWYLAADSSQVDTVEITFLQGEESPVIDTEEDFDTDTYKYKIRQTMGAKAIDWRGLFRNSA